MTPAPNPGPRHGPERIHERAADPAEAANRPLEPTSSQDELLERDEPHPPPDRDPHHGLNNPAGTPDPEADSDPYRPAAPDDEADRASGVRGSGEGAEGR